MANYATAALIRDCHEEFASTTDYPDATLTAAAENYAEPIVDARLTAAGVTMPITSVTNETLFKPVRLAASYLTAHHLLRKNARARFEPGDGVAGMLRETAIQILEDIAIGKLDIGETRSSYGNAVVDATTDTHHEDKVFDSVDETGWAELDEARGD